MLRRVVALSVVCSLFLVAGCASGEPDGRFVDAGVSGVVNFRATMPQVLEPLHRKGQLDYPMSPPVGGPHNGSWQNCEGDVYPEPVPDEHAVHSLEHGAVWVTYNPRTASAADIATLESTVLGRDYMLMSPYPRLDRPVSLQAWGYQLKVGAADDPRVEEFISRYRKTAGLERGATCGGGTTITGDAPLEIGPDGQPLPR